MRPLFIFLLCYSFAIQASAQNREILLSFGLFKIYDTIKVPVGKPVIVTVKVTSREELDKLLRKTTLRLLDTLNVELLNVSLFDRLKTPGALDTLLKGDILKPFNLMSFFRDMSKGQRLVIMPFLGDQNGRPVADAKQPIVVLITDDAPAVAKVAPEVITGIESNVRKNQRDITDLKADVQQNKEDAANGIKRVDDKVSEIRNEIIGTIEDGKLKKRQKRKMLFSVDDFRESPVDLSYFKECNTCSDHTGDLIYDFRCKKVYEAVVKLNDKRTVVIYRQVRDLSSIKVNAQKLLQLKVVGVNRYLYNVNAKVEDSIYGSEPPPIFSQFFSGSSDLFSDLIAKGKASLFQGDIEDTTNSPFQKQFNDLKDAMLRFKELYNVLLNKQVKAFLYCIDPAIECCGAADLTSYSSYADRLSDVLTLIAQIEAMYLTELPSGTALFSKITDLEGKIAACKKATADHAAAKAELEKATTDPEKKTLTEKVNKLKEALCAENAIPGYEDEIKKLKEKLPFRITMDAMKTALPTMTQLRKLYLFARNVVKDHYFYRLPPIYPQGDNMNIVIDINARDSAIAAEMGYMPVYHDQLNLGFSVRWKTIFSFSTGPFLAFGADLPVQSYGFKKVPTLGTTIGAGAKHTLHSTGGVPLPAGLGGFANFGVKMSRHFGVGGTVGAGYTFNQDEILPAFMGGITFSFGDRQRLNLTFGAAGVQVKELKETLYKGYVYDELPTLEYHKPIRFGLFAAVSYSVFTSTSRINIFSKSKN